MILGNRCHNSRTSCPFAHGDSDLRHLGEVERLYIKMEKSQAKKLKKMGLSANPKVHESPPALKTFKPPAPEPSQKAVLDPVPQEQLHHEDGFDDLVQEAIARRIAKTPLMSRNFDFKVQVPGIDISQVKLASKALVAPFSGDKQARYEDFLDFYENLESDGDWRKSRLMQRLAHHFDEFQKELNLFSETIQAISLESGSVTSETSHQMKDDKSKDSLSVAPTARLSKLDIPRTQPIHLAQVLKRSLPDTNESTNDLLTGLIRQNIPLQISALGTFVGDEQSNAKAAEEIDSKTNRIDRLRLGSKFLQDANVAFLKLVLAKICGDMEGSESNHLIPDFVSRT
jgi:hypothetical protein